VFEVSVEDEGQDAWLLLAKSKRFDEAFANAGDNKKRIDEITAYKANHLFEVGEYSKAAELYAKVPHLANPTATAIKLCQIKQQTVLRKYLRLILDSCPNTNFIQITSIVTWLIQMYLDKLSRSRSKRLDTMSIVCTLRIHK